MISKLLQRIGLKRKTNWHQEWYQITVYIMSEGTAQGQPRPLMVCKETLSWWTDEKSDRADGLPGPKSAVDSRVHSILHDGYHTTQSNGVDVHFSPHSIYKVTWERIDNDMA